MTKVVREKGEVAPEVSASWGKFEQAAEELLNALRSQDPRAVVEAFAESVSVWGESALAEDTVKAFWAMVEEDAWFWFEAVVRNLDRRDLAEAIKRSRTLTDFLIYYAEPLGVEIPPEEGGGAGGTFSGRGGRADRGAAGAQTPQADAARGVGALWTGVQPSL